jgi:hypothetical protein
LDEPTWLYAIVFDDGRRDPAQTLDDAIRRAAMAAAAPLSSSSAVLRSFQGAQN